MKALGTMPKTVAVIAYQLNDFRQGAKACQIVKDIESMGHGVKVPEKKPKTRGRPPKQDLTADQIEKYKALFRSNTADHVLNVIKRDTGLELSRHQLRSRLNKKTK